MDTNRMTHRVTSVLLVAALATSLLAPAAEAGHRRSRRPARRPAPVVVVERHSNAGAVVGFLGGLVLGAVMANAQPAPPPACERAWEPGYDYYDPYCHETFGSLVRYEDHLDRHRHPRTAEVVDVRTGRVVDTVRWYDGRWVGADGGVIVARDVPPYEEWDD